MINICDNRKSTETSIHSSNMKLAIGILVIGIAALSSAAPYEATATKQGKLAKLESLLSLGRALLKRAVREQSDDSDDDDGLADLLAIMEGDDDNSEDDDGANTERLRFHKIIKGGKKLAGRLWKKYGGTVKQLGKNYLKSKGLPVDGLMAPTKLQDNDDDDDGQATIEELLALLQDDNDYDDSDGLADIEVDTGDDTDTSDGSNDGNIIDELLAQLQNHDLADIKDTSDTSDDDDDDDGNLAELQLAGVIRRRLRNGVRNIANRLRRRFCRSPPPPGPAPPPPPPKGHPALRRFFH